MLRNNTWGGSWGGNIRCTCTFLVDDATHGMAGGVVGVIPSVALAHLVGATLQSQDGGAFYTGTCGVSTTEAGGSS